MKRFAALLTCILITAVSAGVPTAFAESSSLSGTTINVFNWGQYIGNGEEDTIDVISEFEKKTGIKVNYSTFDSNESMYTKIKAGGSSYDIIIPSDYMIGRLIEEGQLEKLDFNNIPNFKYIDESFLNPEYDPTGEYSVPYTWGTVGIIYNTKYVDKVDSWSALWDERYKDKILMFGNVRDAFAASELYLGIDPNTNDLEQIKKAAQKLKEQKPLVQEYVMDQVFTKMENEEAWIAPYYAGDYFIMQEENENLAFAYPKEGFNLFVDAICIPKGARNKAGAEAFINFLCDPEICGLNCEAIGYSAPISAAKEYISEEYINEISYPSEEVLSNGVSFVSLNDETNLSMDSLFWDEVRSSTDRSYLKFVIAGVLVAGIVIYSVIRKRHRNKYY